MVRHTITLEIELDVDVPEGLRWSDAVKDDVEAHVDAMLREHLDGRDVALRDGATLHVDGHSVVLVPGAWPYR